MDMQEFIDPFARMLADLVSPSAVRAVERGEGAAQMWQGFEDSGFLDALVPESAGGAGLSLADIFPLIALVGAEAVPLPVGETMIARALLAYAGLAAPQQPIAFASGTAAGQVVPCGLVAGHILHDNGSELKLYATADCDLESTGVEGSLAARFDARGTGVQDLPRPQGGLRAIAAVLRAILIAGAANRLVEVTTAYANERIQFGKPIGRQQALQQNLAVMAEDMIAARIAAQLGAAAGLCPALAVAGTAKSVASAAAARVANTAHAVHGAIGISEEYDLHLLTRRLHEWRLADGSESFWSKVLGNSRLARSAESVDWIRSEIFV